MEDDPQWTKRFDFTYSKKSSFILATLNLCKASVRGERDTRKHHYFLSHNKGKSKLHIQKKITTL